MIRSRARNVIRGGNSRLTPSTSGMAAWYRPGVGQTDAGAGACSAWADQSGNGRNLTQGTGANRPTIQSDGSLVFDGVSDFLTAAFTLNQPFTLYAVMNQLTWTANDILVAGGNAGAPYNTYLQQVTATPRLVLVAGAVPPEITTLAVNTKAVVTIVLNDTASSFAVNNGAPTTMTTGGNAAGGLTLGAAPDGTFPSNIRVWEVIARTGADDAATRAAIWLYLSRTHGI